MTSELAKEDLNDLRAEGLQPTDEDVIRLHALACRLSDGAETTAACAPRVAFAGGVVFHEPTIAAWQWFENAKDYARAKSEEDWYFAFACANGRRTWYLQNLIEEKDVNRAVVAWLKTVAATKDEVSRAVYYVTTGLNDITPEKTDLKKKTEADKAQGDRERENYAEVERVLREAAASTSLTLGEIMSEPISRLQGMIYEANIKAGFEMSRKTAKAHAEYLATLKAIKARLISEKEAACATS